MTEQSPKTKEKQSQSEDLRKNKDPLHGVTLKMILEELHQTLGWQGLSENININCFKSNPSIKSSLTFLRRTPWAREKVEHLYVKQKGLKPAHKKAPSVKATDDPWLRNKL